MINYRIATMEDLNTLVELRLQFLDAKTQDSNFFAIFQNTRQYFEESLSNQTCKVVLACDGPKIIGVGMIYFYESMPSLVNISGITGYITNLFVQLNYRRNGVGKNLINQLIEISNKKDVKVILASVTDISSQIFASSGFARVNNTMIYQQ